MSPLGSALAMCGFGLVVLFGFLAWATIEDYRTRREILKDIRSQPINVVPHWEVLPER